MALRSERVAAAVALSVAMAMARADTPSVDLTVTALSGAPATAAAGTSFSVSSTVKTTGAVNRSFTVSFYLSTDSTITATDTVIGSRAVASLARNASSTATTTVTVPGSLAPRTYYIGAIVDSGKVVSESNENNNSRAGTAVQVTAAGGVDLTVTALSGAPATVVPGGTFSLSNTVSAAPTGAAGAFTVGLYLSSDTVITTADTLIGSRLLGSLAAGTSSAASTTVTIPSNQPAGTYYVGAVADSLGQVVETNEGNNALLGTQVRVVRPDLTVTALSGVPNRIGLGDSFTVADSVANDPTGAAAGAFTVGYYLSATSNVTTSGVLLGSRTVPGLVAGQSSAASTALSIPTSLPPGTWYLGAIADTGNAVAESIETNNAAVSAAFEVGAISCQQPPEPIDDGNPCTADACDPVLGVSHTPSAAGAACSDGNYCNGAETCDGAGSCLPGLPPSVDDGNPCTADACDAQTGVWHAPLSAGTSCSDGDACNGAEACDGAGACFAGSPPSLDDGNACTADACDPVTGVGHTPISGCVVLPPDPAAVAPPHDLTVATDFASSTSFLYSGTNPIQTGVAPGAIEARRAAVVRGKASDRSGAPLGGVKVTVLGHPELGETFTRADGQFDLAVNGGGQLTIDYRKDGFLQAQRQVRPGWRDYASVDEVVLTPFDPHVTPVGAGAGGVQVARGSTVTDADGARTATMLFQPGTQASMQLQDGSSVSLSTFHVRATEFTVGPVGQRAMPAALPATSGFTYAAELSVDEAVAAGARAVSFDRPVPVYLENFLGIPTGWPVPSGYYDRERGVWEPAPDGRVIEILSVTAGQADLDADGDGQADTPGALADLGFTSEELQTLASTYAAGQTLWRVPVSHFSVWDFNYAWDCAKDSSGAPLCAAPVMDPPDVGGPRPDDPDIECGSVIECQSQVLGEELPIAGTPYSLSYRSGRQPGRTADRVISVKLPAAAPALAVGMLVEVHVAGQTLSQDLPAAQQGVLQFVWDGKDVYGRFVQGSVPVVVRIGYRYPVRAILVRSAGGSSFGASGGVAGSFSNRTSWPGSVLRNTSHFRTEPFLVVWTTWRGQISVWMAPPLGLGGWTLSAHHAFRPDTGVIEEGTGIGRRAKGSSDVIASVSTLPSPSAVAIGPDGALYVVHSDARLAKVDPSGAVTPIVGAQATCSTPAEGMSAALACMVAWDVALLPNGEILIPDLWGGKVWRIGLDGILHRFAGGGTASPGDGGLATAARFSGGVSSVAVGPDGSVFIHEGTRIRRVDASGIITTVAGAGTVTGDNVPAYTAVVAEAGSYARISAGPDGSIFYFSSSLYYSWIPRRYRRIGTDGIVRPVAGSGSAGFSGDGGPAVAAQLNVTNAWVRAAPAVDGSVFVADEANYRVRLVGPDGLIRTVAGDGTRGYSGDGGPATQAQIGQVAYVAVGPDGSLFIADKDNNRVRKITSGYGFAGGGYRVPSVDGARVHEFDAAGRHLRTLHASTGAVLLTFGYDAAGLLASVADGDGNVTTIERDAAGGLAAIVAPYGQRTSFTLDGNGYLATASNPANETTSFTYDTGGLLQTLTDPRLGVHTFRFDSLGRLTRDENPAGGVKVLGRTDAGRDYAVSVTTAMGRVTQYEVQDLTDGNLRMTRTDPDGTAEVALHSTSGTVTKTRTDGTVAVVRHGPDPRFGMEAPVQATTLTTPGGRAFSTVQTRTATLADPKNPLSATALGETVTVNGRAWSSTYASSTRQVTSRTPAGRTTVTTLDAKGKPARIAPPGVVALDITYDASGRPEWVTQGTRTFRVEYDAAGFPWRLTDPLSRQVTFEYDQAGRVWRQTLPGGRQVVFAPDPNGNLASLTPPGRQAHGFTYWPGDAVKSYDPPAAYPGAPLWATGYGYDLDGALTSVSLPDGTSIVPSYEPTTGRLSSVTTAHEVVGVGYDPQGRVATVTGAEESLTYGYDGFLVTSEAWAGTVPGTVGYGYDNNFRVTTQTVNGASLGFGYDADGLLTSAGAVTIGREATTGRVSGSTLGTVTTTQTYTTYGEPWVTTASVGGSAVYSYTLNRNALSSRVDGKTETIGGVTTTMGYGYDAAGRLETVTVNGTLVATYGYDLNGNRTSRTTTSGTEIGVPDEQDRLVSYGGATYTYRTPGAMESKTDGSGTTWYDYDALGNLRSVLLPGGGRVDYVIDGLNRRIGKKVNGTLTEGFLYEGKLRPVAWLDGTGQVYARFVYGTRVNVPEYMVTPSGTYRLVTDHLGSPRLVIDTATGSVAQRVDYDEWGVVLADTNPGFQPFGFAGGLYDRDTGLVRFGARDYEPRTGRWTNKDPIRFRGGTTNLYEYAASDPVNLVDPSGLADVFVALEGDLVGVTGGEGGFGIVFDTSNPLNSGVFATGGPATGANAGASLSFGFALRGIDGWSTNVDLNAGKLSPVVSFDNKGFNGAAVGVGPGLGLSVSQTYTWRYTVNDFLSFLKKRFGDDEPCP